MWVKARLPVPVLRQVAETRGARDATATNNLCEKAHNDLNRNALSLVRTDTLELWGTAILDDAEQGAANPWDVCFSADGARLVLSHAGTHELSVIDCAAIVERVAAQRRVGSLFDAKSLKMMTGIRKRITLPVVGPRAICLVGNTVYAAGYFTSLKTVDSGLGTGVQYDVPSLVEAWRSAPYLHHGDGLSLEETVIDFNHLQKRGKTNGLRPAERSDLLEYLRSL